MMIGPLLSKFIVPLIQQLSSLPLEERTYKNLYASVSMLVQAD